MSYVLRLSFVYSTAFRQHPINMRPPRMDTAQLSLVRTPFDDPDFLFELKHDGFRALAHIWDGKCELVSRRRNAYKSFNELRENLAKLKVKNAVIDGELVCLDSEGRSIFNELLFRRACPIFYAFDLLYLNDRDLRQRPLEIKNPHYTQSERRHELFETFKSKQTAQPPIPRNRLIGPDLWVLDERRRPVSEQIGRSI